MSDIENNPNLDNRTAASSGHVKQIAGYQARFKVVSGIFVNKERSGSNSNLTNLSASSMLDSAKMMSLQDDAQSRRISSEVLRRCLYKSVAAPCKRRIANRKSYCSPSSSFIDSPGDIRDIRERHKKLFMSVPVTPSQSLAVTPSHSPTENRSFFGFLSHSTTPRCVSPVCPEDDEENSCKGLASIFQPHPRYVSANGNLNGQQQVNDDNGVPIKSSSSSRTPFSLMRRRGLVVKGSEIQF